MLSGLHLHCCFWEGKITPRLPNTSGFVSVAFSSVCKILPLSSELWNKAGACNPSRFTFHPSKLAMGILVHFRDVLYAVNSFLSIFLPDTPLLFYPYFNNSYKWQFAFLFCAAALLLCFVPSLFHFLAFFPFSLHLPNNVDAWKCSSVSILFK